MSWERGEPLLMACPGTRLWDWAARASLAPEREGAAHGLGRCGSGAVPLLCLDVSTTASKQDVRAKCTVPSRTAREAVMAPGTVGVTEIRKVSAPSVFTMQSHCIMTFKGFARHFGGVGERGSRGQGVGSRACRCQC